MYSFSSFSSEFMNIIRSELKWEKISEMPKLTLARYKVYDNSSYTLHTNVNVTLQHTPSSSMNVAQM